MPKASLNCATVPLNTTVQRPACSCTTARPCASAKSRTASRSARLAPYCRANSARDRYPVARSLRASFCRRSFRPGLSVGRTITVTSSRSAGSAGPNALEFGSGLRSLPLSGRVAITLPPRLRCNIRGYLSAGHAPRPDLSQADDCSRRLAGCGKLIGDELGDGKGRRHPRGLYAIEVDEPAHAVRLRPLDEEVCRGRARAAQLGTDTGIAGAQRPVGQCRPVAADRPIETIGAGRINGVIQLLDPLDVRPELRLAGEVEREVHAQAAGLRDRIDEVFERRLPLQHVIVALGVEGWRNAPLRNACDVPRQLLSVQAGAVDYDLRRELRSLVGADFEPNGVAAAVPPRHRRVACDDAAGVLEIPPQREHEAVAVDDARGGREERRHTTHGRLQGHRFRGRQPVQIIDTVGAGRCLDPLQRLDLLVIGGYDQLAATAMFDAMRLAVGIQALPAGDTELGLGGSGRVVDPGVNDLAVARAGPGADGACRLEDQDLTATHGQGPRYREADDARADDDAIDFLRHAFFRIPAGAPASYSLLYRAPDDPPTLGRHRTARRGQRQTTIGRRRQVEG